MHILNTLTILLAGCMVGNELAISAFVNPAIWRLDNSPQAQGLSNLARSLGRVMPFWYGLCLTLFVLQALLHRHDAALVPLLIATFIWLSVIVFTISKLVPLNNRIASLNTTNLMPGWRDDHTKWDSFHRIRIVLLAVAFFVFVDALVA